MQSNRTPHHKNKTMKSTSSTVAFFVIFCLLSFDTKSPGNFFTIGNNRYALSFSEIANESYSTKSKFEVDLLTEEKELAKAKTFIWFSLTSNNTATLADGIYQFSSGELNDRLPLHFNGSVKINNHVVEIIGGTVSIAHREREYDIQFILKLQNGDQAKGMYRG